MAGHDKKLDEPANRRYFDDDTVALRDELATWQLEKPNPELPSTLTSPLLKKPAIDLMVAGYRELVKGFDDALVKWGDFRKDTTRRKARQSVPALRLKHALSECEQVRDYVHGMAASEQLDQDGERGRRLDIAHYLMGSMVIRAIMTAQEIGITPANVERDFF